MGAGCSCMEKKKIVQKIEPKVLDQEKEKPKESIFVVSEKIQFEPIREQPPTSSETPQPNHVKEEVEIEKDDKVTPLPAAPKLPREQPKAKKLSQAGKALSIPKPKGYEPGRSSSVAVTKLDQNQMKEL